MRTRVASIQCCCFLRADFMSSSRFLICSSDSSSNLGFETSPYTRFGSERIFADTARRSVSPVIQSRVFLNARMVFVSACWA